MDIFHLKINLIEIEFYGKKNSEGVGLIINNNNEKSIIITNVIFRNLFENTLRHNPDSKKVIISASKIGQNVELTYDDQGKKFQGNSNRLGELFYKFNSTKGTGVGLYLIKNLMRKMDGSFQSYNAMTEIPASYRIPDSVVSSGHGTIAIPGVVAGLVKLHEDHGSLPLETVMQGAIELALSLIHI